MTTTTTATTTTTGIMANAADTTGRYSHACMGVAAIACQDCKNTSPRPSSQRADTRLQHCVVADGALKQPLIGDLQSQTNVTRCPPPSHCRSVATSE